ncbi:NeuD/PglB/VioB family sugar acetyltransferase [Desertimonas flava]|uniref:NeuD/PglB/VioB family sugar acetyltransferase n=1 Tax=Desertimonas flava TaxID=2064846 RepID=UPI001968CE02|nr:NeuD/PglB/VioB family sugar acetyltransferase [Desertimonas flava]
MRSPTTSGPIIIVGAGGFGREVLDIVEAINVSGGDIDFLGFVDDGDVDEGLLHRRSSKLLGPSSIVVHLAAKYVIGIGSGEIRRRLATEFDSLGAEAAILVHPAATIGGDSHLSPGCIVAAGARVTTNIRLGRHTQLHVNSTVGHDSTLSDFVSVYPGATVSGNVTLAHGVTIGTGANVLPGRSVGASSMVGAGAVVTRDVEPDSTVVGSPARCL